MNSIVYTPGDEKYYNSRPYERYVPIEDRLSDCLIDSKFNDLLVSTGGTVAPDKVFDSASNEPRQLLETCFFGKVASILDYPVSPHNVFGFGAYSPLYIIVIVQFIFVSHLWWTHAPIDVIIMRNSGKPNRPYDLVVAILILLGGVAFTFVASERMKVVYSNMVFGCIALLFVGLMEIYWLMGSVGVGMNPSVPADMVEITSRADNIQKMRTNGGINFFNGPGLRLDHLVIHPTNMPLVPLKDQGKHLGDMGFIMGGVQVLFEQGVLVIPRYVIFSFTVPALIMSSIFLHNEGVWHNVDITFVSFAVFGLYSLMVPIYTISLLCKYAERENTTQQSSSNKREITAHTISGWFFVYFYCIAAFVFAMVGLTHYMMLSPHWFEFPVVVFSLGMALLGLFTTLCVCVYTMASSSKTNALSMYESELRTVALSCLGFYFLITTSSSS